MKPRLFCVQNTIESRTPWVIQTARKFLKYISDMTFRSRLHHNILNGVAMKRVMIILVLLSQNAFAEEVISLKHDVDFDHQSHKTERVGKCVVCHERKLGKIAGFGRAWAHKNCIDCHDLYQEGPRRCGGCHRHKENA